MKNRYTSFILSLFVMMVMSKSVQSQFILGLSAYPQNPTTNDPVQIIAHVGFPSGDCIEKTLSFTTNQNSIQANALHCLGLATFICYDYDTFNLGTLNAGSYTFHFQLDAGQGMMPCTPGINPGPLDSLSFTVTTPTALTEIADFPVELFPIPSSGYFEIKSDMSTFEKLTEITVFQLNGKIMRTFSNPQPGEQFRTHGLAAGCYSVKFVTHSGRTFYKKLIVQ